MPGNTAHTPRVIEVPVHSYGHIRIFLETGGQATFPLDQATMRKVLGGAPDHHSGELTR